MWNWVSTDITYDQLHNELLSTLNGALKNSDGKNVFWHGFNSHIAFETSSQFILGSLLSNGNLNDGKAA